ncbi:hypothetical protein BH10CYA1_BH10CYA1_59390 [soil metagenome]
MKSVPLKILLIEDSPTDALLMTALLQRVTEFVFELDHASELAQGLRRLAESSYDAVLLDLGLPDSVGIETYDRLRALAPEELPIIIVSGNDDRTLLTLALNKGADNYLLKDAFDGNRVAIAVLSAIRNRARNLAEKVPPPAV